MIVFSGVPDPAMLETLAFREALAQAQDFLLTDLYIAFGCKMVVQDISEGTLERYSSIIREIQTLS